jgi:cysteine desulfurase
MHSQTLYLDHANATRPSEQALGRMVALFTDQWGSSLSPHRLGQRLHSAIEEGYRDLYKTLGASEEATIILTSSGAEAVNQVIQGTFLEVTRQSGKNQFVTSQMDEAPAIMAMGRLEQLGCVSKLAAASKTGQVTRDIIADALSPRTALVSLSWANGLTGVIQPVAEIAELCRQRGARLHLDATHVIGKLALDLAEINPDFVTFNGDALHGPKGTGALYIRPGLRLPPLIAGGLAQSGLRGGDLNVAGLVGLGVACREAIEATDFLCTEVARLRNRLEQGILAGCPHAQALFQEQERVPHISAMAFPGVVNEAFLFVLNRQGLCASIGGGLFQQMHRVLEATGMPPEVSLTALSFALARTTTESEIDRAIAILCTTYSKMQKLSQHLLKDAS